MVFKASFAHFIFIDVSDQIYIKGVLSMFVIVIMCNELRSFVVYVYMCLFVCG